MIRLSRKAAEPRRVPLPGGAALFVRPATVLDYEPSLAAARRAASAIGSGQDTVQDYGLPIALDEALADDDRLAGLSEIIVLAELGVKVVTRWEGIVGDDGQPAPLTRENLALLFLDVSIAARFKAVALASLFEEQAEGNGFAPSPTGAGAGEPITAPPASVAATPAPVDGAASTATAAPSANTL